MRGLTTALNPSAGRGKADRRSVFPRRSGCNGSDQPLQHLSKGSEDGHTGMMTRILVSRSVGVANWEQCGSRHVTAAIMRHV